MEEKDKEENEKCQRFMEKALERKLNAYRELFALGNLHPSEYQVYEWIRYHEDKPCAVKPESLSQAMRNVEWKINFYEKLRLNKQKERLRASLVRLNERPEYTPTRRDSIEKKVSVKIAKLERAFVVDRPYNPGKYRRLFHSVVQSAITGYKIKIEDFKSVIYEAMKDYLRWDVEWKLTQQGLDKLIELAELGPNAAINTGYIPKDKINKGLYRWAYSNLRRQDRNGEI